MFANTDGGNIGTWQGLIVSLCFHIQFSYRYHNPRSKLIYTKMAIELYLRWLHFLKKWYDSHSLVHFRLKYVLLHYNDVIMGAMASQITSLTIAYSTVYSGADQRKLQSSASLVFVWGIHRWPMNSPYKWPIARKMFPFDYGIMLTPSGQVLYGLALCHPYIIFDIELTLIIHDTDQPYPILKCGLSKPPGW